MTQVINVTSTINADVIELDPGEDAIQFGAADITITVAAGISVAAGDGFGISSDQDGSMLINNGAISSFGITAVLFDGDDATLTNNANIGGLIDGVRLGGDDATVTNHGGIFGLQGNGVRLGLNSDDVVLNNDGEIYGQDTGILAFSSIDGGTINNSGLIHSDQFGISLMSLAAGLTTVINNAAGGTIQGTGAAISASNVGLSLDNSGTIAGIIDVGSANDVVINRGTITGQVLLGSGNDIYNGTGGNAANVLGENGNDTLTGGNGNDTLNGGAGNDTVRGGRGKDFLFGDTERDLFDFNSIKDSLKGSKRDVIQDFARGNNVTGDDIDLRTIDAKTGVSGNNKFKFIGKQDFHDQKGELRYEDKGSQVIIQGDRNGDGKADFEILVKVGALGAGDFLL